MRTRYSGSSRDTKRFLGRYPLSFDELEPSTLARGRTELVTAHLPMRVCVRVPTVICRIPNGQQWALEAGIRVLCRSNLLQIALSFVVDFPLMTRPRDWQVLCHNFVSHPCSCVSSCAPIRISLRLCNNALNTDPQPFVELTYYIHVRATV